MFFDFRLLLFISPALILAFIASMMVKAAYAQARGIPARLTGYATARNILDRAGLYDVEIEQVPGEMSDHYDPRDKVVRLSPDVYHGHSLAAVGIAAHEVGHAIQDAQQYGPLVIRNAAVTTAGFGGNIGMLLVMLGLAFALTPLAWAGVALFACVVFFQLVNLPVEFDASARAKVQLVEMGICSDEEMYYVRKVLNAAALTYVAATLQAILTLLYYVLRVMAASQRDER